MFFFDSQCARAPKPAYRSVYMAKLTLISAIADMFKMQELVKADLKGHQGQQDYLALTWDIVFLQNLLKFLGPTVLKSSAVSYQQVYS